MTVIQNNKKIYFASDFHLGAPNDEISFIREKKICSWLENIKPTCKELFLVGDIFDFWFEYKHSIPKGFVRLQAKICEFTDAGIPVHFFTGNHDMWAFNYLSKELGVKIYREPKEFIFNDKSFFIGHGDGLGPGDLKYKFLKKLFKSKVLQFLFARLHPNFSFGIASYFSKSSRKATGTKEDLYLGDEKEWLVQFCLNSSKKYNFFIFGHRHLPIYKEISEHSIYINLGDWIKDFTFAEFDGNNIELKSFKENLV